MAGRSRRAGSIEVGYEARDRGERTLCVATVSKVIYSSFDRALSDYLHATQGRAFPRFAATMHEKVDESEDAPKQVAERFFTSIPESLAWIGERALDGRDQATVFVRQKKRRQQISCGRRVLSRFYFDQMLDQPLIGRARSRIPLTQ